MNRKKYLAKNTALFALNSIGTKLIVFLLVPVYTGVLSTEEFGIVDLVTTLATVIVPILILNINEAIQRFCLDENADHCGIMNVGIVALLFSLVAGLLIVPISSLVDSIAPFAFLFYIYCVTQGVCIVLASFLRGKEKLTHFAICSILITLSGALLSVLFLVVFHTGVEGYFWAFILSYIIGGCYAAITGGVRKIVSHFSFDRRLAKRMLSYSILLIPNALMWWIMNASDRIMVAALVGLSANGIYAISYKVPSVVSTLSTVFNQAWSFSAIKEDKSEDRLAFNRKMYDVLFDAQILLTVLLIVAIRVFMKVYVQDSYYSAWVYTVPLLVGYFFMSLGTFFSVQYTVNKDSKGFVLSGMVGAGINIVLNFILIPLFGVMGAAIATMFSYVGVFVYRARDVQKYLELKAINRNKFWLILMLIVVATTVYVDIIWLRITLLLIECVILVFIMRKTVVDMVGFFVNQFRRVIKKG